MFFRHRKKKLLKCFSVYSPKIQKAMLFAQKIHAGKLRSTGENFIEHPKAVMKILEPFDVPESFLEVALLHDVIEESGLSSESLSLLFDSFVAQCVEYLSKEDFPSYEERIEKYIKKLERGVCFSECVYLVKLIDVYHNLHTLYVFSEEKQQKQINEMYYYYIPFFHENFSHLSYKYRAIARLFVKNITSYCLNKRKNCCHALATEL